MRTYELTLTPNYVSDWTFYDAIRELIQNGTDQEIINPDNKFSLVYQKDEQKLLLINDHSKLEIASLLLGNSSKSYDENTVGQFGEGYKIAALVLNRLGKKMTILNNAADEIWYSDFRMSEKWRQKMLTFEVKENISASKCLIICIDNVSNQEYLDIEQIWLYMHGKDSYGKIDTDYGEILTDPAMSGLIFVNGLSVSTYSEMHYGYNFKPNHIRLERDRKTCRDWEMGFVTARMICQAVLRGKLDLAQLSKLADLNGADVKNMKYICYEQNTEEIVELLLEQFDNQYPDSIPVGTQEEFDRVKTFGGNPIIVPDLVAELLTKEMTRRTHRLAVSDSVNQNLTIKEQIERWLRAYFDKLPGEAIDELRRIINKM